MMGTVNLAESSTPALSEVRADNNFEFFIKDRDVTHLEFHIVNLLLII